MYTGLFRQQGEIVNKESYTGSRKNVGKRIQQFINDDGYAFYSQYKEYMKPIKNRPENRRRGKYRDYAVEWRWDDVN